VEGKGGIGRKLGKGEKKEVGGQNDRCGNKWRVPKLPCMEGYRASGAQGTNVPKGKWV